MINRARALVAAASPRPWSERCGDIVQLTDAGKGYPLDMYPDSATIVDGKCEQCGTSTALTAANAALIAEAPTLIAELCDLTELRGNEVAHLAHECGTAKGQRDNARRDLAKAHVLLDVVRRKLGYLLRDYPGDKETCALIANIDALLKESP